MKNRVDLLREATRDESEVAKRKRAFQKENRKQMREGKLSKDEVSFIPSELAKNSIIKKYKV